jgi:hypothetical protein
VAFLIDQDETVASTLQIVGNRKRCRHVLFFLGTLVEQRGERGMAS